MPVNVPLKREPAREWQVTGRFVAIAVVLFFTVVATVNGIMMTFAITTFPGIDAKNGYETSQNYNKEIAAAREQAARGWTSALSALPSGSAAVLGFSLKDRYGAAVAGLDVTAHVAHPTDKRRDHSFALAEIRPGFYEATEKGLGAGAWKVRIVARRGDERVFVSDRTIELR